MSQCFSMGFKSGETVSPEVSPEVAFVPLTISISPALDEGLCFLAE